MKIKEKLEELALSKNVDALREYVKKHNTEIYEIYCKEGSGSQSLLSAYEKICMTDTRTASAYQEIMETSIAGDVLFTGE
jgi:hypothetical protein